MPIPGTEEFESFLGTLELTEVALGISPRPPRQPFLTLDSVGEFVTKRGQLFVLCRADGLAPETVVSRVRKELRSLGCPDDRDSAVANLAMFTALRSPESPAVGQLNEFLAATHVADLSQWIIFPFPTIEQLRWKMAGFTCDEAEVDRILYRVESMARSGLPLDARWKWKGKLALSRDVTTVRLVDWQSAHAGVCSSRLDDDLRRRLLDDYYYAAAEFYLGRFRDELSDAQMFLEAGGLSCFPPSVLDALVSFDQLSLFVWGFKAGRVGWATLSFRDAMALRVKDPMSRHIAWMEQEFGTARPSGHPADTMLATFCRLLQRARRHWRADRFPEAFLHFVIGLDLLLGLEGASAETVASRAAVCSLGDPQVRYLEQKKRVKRLYGARSKYVHDGIEPIIEQLEEVDKLCRGILWTLMRMRMTPATDECSGDSGEVYIERWRKRLDLIAAKLEAEELVSAAEYRGLGIGGGGSAPQTSGFETVVVTRRVRRSSQQGPLRLE